MDSHFVRYGTAAEQRCMKDCRHTYDGVVINGNTLAYTPRAISMFVHSDVANKKYFVDPKTHSFQHDLEKITNKQGAIKSSVRKLIDIYGEPISTAILKELRPVKKEDFASPKTIRAYVKKVLEFQYDYAKNIDDQYREYVEYSDYGKKRPFVLIAPYFYLDHVNWKDWRDLNSEMIRVSMEHKERFGGTPIFGQLVIDKELLMKGGFLDNILEAYRKADGLVYWIDGFDETEAGLGELKQVQRMIKRYKEENGKKVFSLYGGYFSELLTKGGLDGVVHGLGYGEDRDVVPVGGGIPLSKYYLPALKKRIPANRMIAILKMLGINSADNFHRNICSCRVCKEIIQGNGEMFFASFNRFIRSKPKIIEYKRSGRVRVREIYYPETESKLLCLCHYLEVKNKEFKEVEKTGTETLINQLDGAQKKYRNCFQPNELSYLDYWGQAISSG